MNDLPPGHSAPELQALLDAAVDAIIIIDHRGVIEVFNHSAERLFGYRSAHIVGKNVGLLMEESERDQHDAQLARYLRTGESHILGVGREVVARRRDGSVFPAFLSIGRIGGSEPPRFVGFLQDRTPQQQAFAAVQRERDRASQYLEAAQTMLIAIDLQHRVTLINRKACEVLGQADSALLGVDWFDSVVVAEDAPKAAFEFDALLEREPRRAHHCEYAVRTAGGEQRRIVWRCVTLEDTDGRTTGVLCSGDDITDSRRTEAEVRAARERLMNVSRLATMGEMTTGISHELNQPLAAISNFAQAAVRLLALPEPALADVREALTQIGAQALRAGEITRRLRTLVPSPAPSRGPVDVNLLIGELESLLRSDARAGDVRIDFELAAQPQYIEADRIQIQQVLLSLLRNAFDALGAVPGKQRQVRVQTRRTADGDVQIRIADSGHGVAPEIRPRLFTPFTTSKPHGTGLGLALSHSIVEAHRGHLEYQVNRPRGAIFVVTLPAADPDRG